MPDNHLDPHRCMAKLNEHCQKSLLKLEYKDIAVTGPPHDRVFTVAVVIDKVQYSPGTGKSKKEAKCLAAVSAWRTIQNQNKGELDSCEQHKEPKLSLVASVPEFSSSDSINYVSMLNEYASKNKVRVQYNLISKTGMDHKPIFSYECQIGDEVFDAGKGNKVQIAKLEAAKLAYEKLNSSSAFRAKERANSISDSSDTTFSSSQGLSSEASRSSTDLDSELMKISDIFSDDSIQLNESSSSQKPVSPSNHTMKPKRKETPLAARFSNLGRRKSKFTVSNRFLKEFDDIETIGIGGFGNVFKAKHIIDDRLCAIKRIRLSGKKDSGEREVKALATLDHRHIVRYYTCWPDQDIFQFPDTSESSSEQFDCLFIQMELCEKGNLADWINQQKENLSCKDDSVEILFQQIVQGVNYIHSMDLIHRDLKPLNIFFHTENHIKIGDFGLVTSGVNDASIQRTTNKGTLRYMAPEQEGCSYGKEVDIFPLGLILYEMLFPFSTSHEKEKEWPNIKEGKLPKTFIEKFTKETSLIKKLLSKEPSQRPSAADILELVKCQQHARHTY
ncbi:interferon-induced, double-stranded RNA-activated protein kinase [Protobothrops mucrosquamatus]|uniref:interferon-induced, double-stranded RNA-activated protein kinase n=1 Tax=Protobothrops mucrosquamatus TaxID=103944 RepID=UPI0007757A1C|nr:interferon-induced, double-stranded RNA-activated protein kinase [Protobothrops mucrosquamatus]